MSFTIEDQVDQKIRAKKKELTRKQIRKQLSRNGYGKYTPFEMDMIISKAFWNLNGVCKNLLLLFLGKRKMRFQKGKVFMEKISEALVPENKKEGSDENR